MVKFPKKIHRAIVLPVLLAQTQKIPILKATKLSYGRSSSLEYHSSQCTPQGIGTSALS